MEDGKQHAQLILGIKKPFTANFMHEKYLILLGVLTKTKNFNLIKQLKINHAL